MNLFVFVFDCCMIVGNDFIICVDFGMNLFIDCIHTLCPTIYTLSLDSLFKITNLVKKILPKFAIGSHIISIRQHKDRFPSTQRFSFIILLQQSLKLMHINRPIFHIIFMMLHNQHITNTHNDNNLRLPYGSACTDLMFYMILYLLSKYMRER